MAGNEEMNVEPLAHYIKSIELLKAGKKQDAETYLASSLGISELTPFMKDNLTKLANSENPHEAILTIIASKMKN